jgi:hypothetical protein
VYQEPDRWKESATVLPSLPEAGNLRPIDAAQASDKYEYLIDRASIVRGTDDVMRYTVVLRAASGLENIFFEGLRCSTNTVRTLGYAANGRFRPSTSNTWVPLASSGARGYQGYLEREIMCGEAGFARDADEAVEALDSQFTSGGVRIEAACDGRAMPTKPLKRSTHNSPQAASALRLHAMDRYATRSSIGSCCGLPRVPD